MRLSSEKVLLSCLLLDRSLADHFQTADVEISTQAQADHYKSCTVFPGSIYISPNFEGTLNLDGIEEIKVSLTSGDHDELSTGNISAITSTTLRSIGSRFELSQLPSLRTLHLPALRRAQKIEWNDLPKLKSVDFGDGLENVSSISITSAGLTSLDGLVTEFADDWSLVLNAKLTQANLSKLTSYKSFTSRANNKLLSIDLSGVTAAGQSDFRDLGSVNLDALQTTTGKLLLLDVKAFNVTFPALQNASAIDVEPGHGPHTVSFPRLEAVHGDFFVYGQNTNLSLPALEGVDGTFQVTTGPAINCSAFSGIRVSGPVNSCENNGQITNYNPDGNYTNAAPNASVGNPVPDNLGTCLCFENRLSIGMALLAAVFLGL